MDREIKVIFWSTALSVLTAQGNQLPSCQHGRSYRNSSWRDFSCAKDTHGERTWGLWVQRCQEVLVKNTWILLQIVEQGMKKQPK